MRDLTFWEILSAKNQRLTEVSARELRITDVWSVMNNSIMVVFR